MLFRSTACGKIENFAMMPMINMAIAMTAYTAQNMGAKKPERVKVGLRYATVFSLIIAAAISALVIFMPQGMMSIFIGKAAPQAVFDIGKNYLMCMAVNMFSMAILFSALDVLEI